MAFWDHGRYQMSNPLLKKHYEKKLNLAIKILPIHGLMGMLLGSP
jgi:hypothetical protein